MTKKKRDAAYLMGTDISTCPRCGDSMRIVHIRKVGASEVDGIVCTRCLWTCGQANLFTALSCKVDYLIHRWLR